MGNEAEMSKYLNKILKNKAKKGIGTLKKSNGEFPDSTRRGDVEEGRKQNDSSSTSFYTF